MSPQNRIRIKPPEDPRVDAILNELEDLRGLATRVDDLETSILSIYAALVTLQYDLYEDEDEDEEELDLLRPHVADQPLPEPAPVEPVVKRPSKAEQLKAAETMNESEPQEVLDPMEAANSVQSVPEEGIVIDES